MTSRFFLTTIGLAAAATLTLAGCGTDSPAASSPPSPAAASSSSTPATANSSSAPAVAGSSSEAAPSGPAVLETASSSLGDVVVDGDGDGRTLYVFDKDTADSGSSACTDQCAAAWPAFAAGSGTPTADGVTGKIGTITGVDGNPQVTLDGRPLYYFAKDAAAGDVAGQGVGGSWWVIGADGAKMTAAGSAAPSSS